MPVSPYAPGDLLRTVSERINVEPGELVWAFKVNPAKEACHSHPQNIRLRLYDFLLRDRKTLAFAVIGDERCHPHFLGTGEWVAPSNPVSESAWPHPILEGTGEWVAPSNPVASVVTPV